MIFIDESVKDKRSLSRLYKYSFYNIYIYKKVVFVWEKRYTILFALILEGFAAVNIFEGACNRKKFVDLFLIKWHTVYLFVFYFIIIIDKFYL